MSVRHALSDFFLMEWRLIKLLSVINCQTVTYTCSIIQGQNLLFVRDYCRRLLSLPFPEYNQIEYNSLEKLLINGRCTIAFTN